MNEVLRDQREWLRVTLSSIGDAVITTDAHGKVTFLNPLAESLTGWSHQQAIGHALDKVFHIVNEETRREVENPALRARREGAIGGLVNPSRRWDARAVEHPQAAETAGRKPAFEDFEVEHDFETIGRKFMALNARRVHKPGNHTQLILL